MAEKGSTFTCYPLIWSLVAAVLNSSLHRSSMKKAILNLSFFYVSMKKQEQRCTGDLGG